ncbi:hypothetical protein PH5382_02826 [Phaeobacter sp. CECT 5382]|nr:hypothetical protein PH5382_02826 [Phaeobacter sp. CECT 5382]
MDDVPKFFAASLGYVSAQALVTPIELTMRVGDYTA